MINAINQKPETRNRKGKPYAFCFLISVFCFLTSGCGWQPVYGAHDSNGRPVAEQLNLVAVDSIPDRQGQILRNELIDRMYGKGRPQQPVYRLQIKLRKQEEELGIQANATSIRSMMNMYADYVLLDNKDKPILKGTAHSVTSFNTLADQYANLAAEEDAIERTLNEVSEQIVNRLSLYFAETPNPHPMDESSTSSPSSPWVKP